MSAKTVNPIETHLRKTAPLIDAEMEKVVPHRFSKAWLETAFGKPDYSYDLNALQKALAEPIWDLLDRGGKRWRPALLILCCEAVNGKKELALHLAPIVEFVHNGTLLHDDIEDNSKTRRGKPCIHLTHGVDVAVNGGSALFYISIPLLIRNAYDLPEKTRLQLYDVISQELLNCHAGQAMDIWWHKGNEKTVSENQYLQMCAYKTGTLARLSAKMGGILGNASPGQIQALGKFGETIGVAFQIQDDLLNLVGEEFQKGKGVGEDIHEGKRTLMVIHCLENGNPNDAKRLVEILNAHPSDEKTIREAIAILQKNGSLDYARKKAEQLMQTAWQQLDKELPPSEAKKTLQSFADYLINRKI